MKSDIKMRTKDVKNFIFREKILFLSKVLQLIDRQAEQVEHMLREQIQMKTTRRGWCPRTGLRAAVNEYFCG